MQNCSVDPATVLDMGTPAPDSEDEDLDDDDDVLHVPCGIEVAAARLYIGATKLPVLTSPLGYSVHWTDDVPDISEGTANDCTNGEVPILTFSIDPNIIPQKGFRKHAKTRVLSVEGAVRFLLIGRSVRAECMHVFLDGADSNICMEMTLDLVHGSLLQIHHLLHPRSFSGHERRRWRQL